MINLFLIALSTYVTASMQVITFQRAPLSFIAFFFTHLLYTALFQPVEWDTIIGINLIKTQKPYILFCPLLKQLFFNSSGLYFANKFEFCGRSIIIQAYVLLVKVKILCVF